MMEGSRGVLYHQSRINKAETPGEIFIAFVISLPWLDWGSGTVGR